MSSTTPTPPLIHLSFLRRPYSALHRCILFLQRFWISRFQSHLSSICSSFLDRRQKNRFQFAYLVMTAHSDGLPPHGRKKFSVFFFLHPTPTWDSPPGIYGFTHKKRKKDKELIQLAFIKRPYY